MVGTKTAKLVERREALALLLAFGALAIPVAGAALSSNVAMPRSDYLFFGAISYYDFVPVLMLVGAFGLLVIGADGRAGSPTVRATSTAAVVALAAAVLAVAYVASAYELRAGGPFDGDAAGVLVGWSAERVVTVASFVATGVLCAVVLAMAVKWMSERNAGATR